jgi:histone-lysine N-methyltransferase SETMAR
VRAAPLCDVTGGTKGTLNKLLQLIRTVRPDRNMKDVLLLHDNAQPHTGLCTREAIAGMERTVLPRPAHSPDLAPSDCHMFGPLKDEVRGRNFARDKELKQNFRDVRRCRGR